MSRRIDWNSVAPLALGLLAVAVRLPHLSAHVFGFDEAVYFMASQSVARHGYVWADMRAIGTAHPPAFYVLMAGWFRLMQALHVTLPVETVHRLPSVLIAGLTTALIYEIGATFGRPAGWLAALAFALHPFLVAYTRLGVLESLLLFALALATYLYLLALRARGGVSSQWLLVSAGTAIGLAILTKAYSGVMLIFLSAHRLAAVFLPGGRAEGETRTQTVRRAAVDLLVLTVSTVAAVLILSAAWAGDPFLLRRVLETEFGWESGVPHGPLWAIEALVVHVGVFVLLIGLQGAGVMVFASPPLPNRDVPVRETRQRTGGEALFPILILGWALTFTIYRSTQFARYLLPLAISLLVPFGVGAAWLAETLVIVRPPTAAGRPRSFIGRRAILSAVIAGIVVANAAALPRVYRAAVVDDWWSVDGFRAAAHMMIERGSQPGDFFVTNSHYTTLSAYTGLPGGLWLSFSGNRPHIFWIWYGDEATTTVALTPEMEARMKYIVIVETFQHIPDDRILFSREVDHTWTAGDAAFLQYLDQHYQQILYVPDPSGAVTLYERTDSE